MRTLRLAPLAAVLLAATALAQGPAPTAIQPDPKAPRGRLPDTAVPRAYRLDFTILPQAQRFSGHDEIDVTLHAPTRSLYLHGRDLAISKATATVGGRTVPASWTQVDATGTARLDFAAPLPAGDVTLAFDYSAPFGDSASGMFHVKIDGQWYSWTQFESIDARAAYPGFDQPGFKTPFTVSVTTHAGLTVVSNAPEQSATPATDGMVTHRFAPTRPLPTYLVAVDTGPFVHRTGLVPADAERPRPMPYGVVATQAQKDKMDYVMAETPRIVSLLERYFGQPFPFPKLDQIGTPIMPGAMENAGADTYGDGIIYLPPGATTGQKQAFGMVVAHELSHQWFGDLVTPAWWDDIWLNESFANWMGYRIGNEWRPELNIGVGAINEGFTAMNTDALEVGRPIHQPILANGEVDSAFDSITYGKGGQVVAMIAAYLGDEKFRDGVRLHLRRHAYGNASSDQFFASLADAAGDPRVVAALRSFVDQQGVPVVTFARENGGLVATQSRYAFLGSHPAPEQWVIPLCFRSGATRTCQLLDRPSMTVTAAGTGLLMPNAGGQGYYRFDLPAADWQKLIAASAELPAGEAIATTDSLWASFRAGRAPAAWLVAEARAMAANPDSTASVDAGERLSGLRNRGLIGPESEGAYRALMASIYAPRLAALGFSPAAGAYASDTPDRQRLRQSLVDIVADDARDPATRATLKAAATRYLAGDMAALDPAFVGAALDVVAEDGGLPAARMLVARGLGTEDPTLRGHALIAAASTGRPDVADYLLGLNDPRLRPYDRIALISALAGTPGTADRTGDWVIANYSRLLSSGVGVFVSASLPRTLANQCSIAKADQIERVLGPTISKANVGVLDFQRTVEGIRNCAVVKQAKAAELRAGLAAG